MGPWLDDRSLCAPRPFGRGRALPRGPEAARAPEPRLGGGSRPIRVAVPCADRESRVSRAGHSAGDLCARRI